MSTAWSARLVSEQLDDGGWNCWAEYGAVVSSAATTINVLEGLLAHEQATGGSAESIEARRRGEEYLLERRLFRRKSTGEVIDPAWLEFSFPTRWHYDVLRALEYFRSAGGPPDPRMAEAIGLLRSKQQPDGTWLLENTHPGQVHFELEDGDGRPSRWNTLRALRVLRWYGAGGARRPPGMGRPPEHARRLPTPGLSRAGPSEGGDLPVGMVLARAWKASARLCQSCRACGALPVARRTFLPAAPACFPPRSTGR